MWKVEVTSLKTPLDTVVFNASLRSWTRYNPWTLSRPRAQDESLRHHICQILLFSGRHIPVRSFFGILFVFSFFFILRELWKDGRLFCGVMHRWFSFHVVSFKFDWNMKKCSSIFDPRSILARRSNYDSLKATFGKFNSSTPSFHLYFHSDICFCFLYL